MTINQAVNIKKIIVTHCIFCIALFPVFCKAQSGNDSITISGDIPKMIVYTIADFNKLKRVVVHVKDKSSAEHDFSGFALTDILNMAGIITPELHKDNLTRYVLIQARDNYKVLFSMAELDSSFSGRTIILADSMDGKPLPKDKGTFRMVVPGEEKKEARWIWSVSSVIIRNAKD